MQSKLFEGAVNEALNNVVIKLSSQDANNFLINRATKHTLQSTRDAKNEVTGVVDKDGQDRQISINDSVKIKTNQTTREHKLVLLRDSLQRMILHQKMDEELMNSNFQVLVEPSVDVFGDVRLRYIPRVVKNPNLHRKIYKYDTLTYPYPDPQFGNQIVRRIRINPLWKAQQIRKQKEKQIQQVKQMVAIDSIQNLQTGRPTVMQSLLEEYQKTNEPLKKRIDLLIIDSLLRFELINKGITLPFFL